MMELQNVVTKKIVSEFNQLQPLFHCKIEVEKHFIKKNSRKIMRRGKYGSPFIGKSEALSNAESFLCTMIQLQLNRDSQLSQPIDHQVWCIFHFYFADYFTKPKSKKEAPRMSLTLGDLSNLYQLPEDCLVKVGVLTNDALVMSHDLSRKLPSFDGKNWLEIFVLKYEENSVLNKKT